MCELELENIVQSESKVQDKFKHAAENNKFYNFLKKVFRKKYKPPKIQTEEGDICPFVSIFIA